jgi:hypothetical protein
VSEDGDNFFLTLNLENNPGNEPVKARIRAVDKCAEGIGDYPVAWNSSSDTADEFPVWSGEHDGFPWKDIRKIYAKGVTYSGLYISLSPRTLPSP